MPPTPCPILVRLACAALKRKLNLQPVCLLTKCRPTSAIRNLDKLVSNPIRRAKRDYKWLTQAQLQKLDGSLTWNYQGPRYDNYYDPGDLFPSPAELGGYSIRDLAMGYQFTPTLLQGKISNLFDKRYETAIGYPATGSGIFRQFQLSDITFVSILGSNGPFSCC